MQPPLKRDDCRTRDASTTKSRPAIRNGKYSTASLIGSYHASVSAKCRDGDVPAMRSRRTNISRTGLWTDVPLAPYPNQEGRGITAIAAMQDPAGFGIRRPVARTMRKKNRKRTFRKKQQEWRARAGRSALGREVK